MAGLLREFGIRPRKRFGQNFLVDENILSKIVEAAQLAPSDVVLEVGPGLGALTAALAARAAQVVAVELDRDLLPVLQATVGEVPNLRLVQGDILDLSLDDLLPPEAKEFKVVANLPYYITSPVLLKFLNAARPWTRLVLMVQREVAERLIAPPGSKEYGSLTISVQFFAEARVVARAPRTAFFPPPEVDSAVVALAARPEPFPPGRLRDTFFSVVRAGFNQRRKTLRRALSGGGFSGSAVEAALAEAAIDGGRRAETLDLLEFVRLATCLESHILSSPRV